MESFSFSSKPSMSQACPKQQRRTWTVPEELQLLIGLKDAVARGWKSENGFRTGYLGVLEQHMAQQFPGANIKAEPHIYSKIHVWKKFYGTISTMLSRSGVGWNDIAHVIEAEDDVWEAFIKYDKDARKVRNKTWPYYHHWCEIFGKDRATGENGTHFGDAIHQLLNPTNSKHTVSQSVDNGVSGPHVESDEESEFMSAVRAESAPSPFKKGKKKNAKRTRAEMEALPVVKMLTNLFEKTDEKLIKLVDKMTSDEAEHAAMRNKVFNSLEDFSHLSIEEKMKVTSVVCDKKDFEIFLNTTPANRGLMIKLILGGKY